MMSSRISNVRPKPDKVLVDIADYVTGYKINSAEAYDTARLCLMDTLGCGLEALGYPACTKLLGPVVPGTVVPNGAKVPGTRFQLDPVQAAFNIGAMIRWLDFNDTWLAAEWGHPSDNLGGILAVADFLTVHLPKTAETIGMFDAKEFAAMKDGIRLLNTARGGIYEEKALVEALKSGKVAGIGVDVYPKEPCTDSPLFAFDQVVATPHLGASTTEAQDKAGVMIAEQVAAALKGQFVGNAVNITPIPADVAEKLQPFIPLCQKLGKALVQLVEGQLEQLEIEYYGHIAEIDTKLLTSAVLMGAFQSVVAEPVNFVNAMVVAEERGIGIRESTQAATKDYVNLITAKSVSDGHSVAVGGTIIGKKDEARFVQMLDFEIDMAPSKYMAFFRYKDVPGMIGKVGTILGREHINIASMQVGRKKIHGEAVMGVNVDSPIPETVLTEIMEQAGIGWARSIVL